MLAGLFIILAIMV